MNPTEDLSNEETAWQAFRYVGGELSVDEEHAFERQLATDQRLREAVASVVETCGVVHAVEAERASDPVSRKRDRSTVLTVSGLGTLLGILAVAVLVAVVVWRPEGTDTSPEFAEREMREDDVRSDGSLVDDEDVLAMWSSSGDEVAADELLADESLVPLSASLIDGDDEFVVPGWMFAALEPERMDGMEGMMDEMPKPGSTNN